MIIDRYIRREIVRPIVPIVAILAALFAGYSIAAFLADAVSGLLAPAMIVQLVALKVLISLEVLLPVALYVSVVLALGRFSGDGELLAAYALRLPPGRVIQAVLGVSTALAVLVGALSLVARPWAYRELHLLTEEAAGTLDASAMRPGTFYVGRNGDRMIFFGRQDAPDTPARDVVIQVWHGRDRVEIIHAASAEQASPASGSSQIVLHDAHVYQLDLARDGKDQALRAAEMIVDPNDAAPTPPEYSSVAASTGRLLHGSSPSDVAELEWRFSTPVSTLLLGLLGIPMGRAPGRKGRAVRLSAAVLAYFAYYVLFTSARTWVQHGLIGAWPGIWWVPALLGLGLVASFTGPGRHEVGTGRA